MNGSAYVVGNSDPDPGPASAYIRIQGVKIRQKRKMFLFFTFQSINLEKISPKFNFSAFIVQIFGDFCLRIHISEEKKHLTGNSENS